MQQCNWLHYWLVLLLMKNTANRYTDVNSEILIKQSSVQDPIFLRPWLQDPESHYPFIPQYPKVILKHFDCRTVGIFMVVYRRGQPFVSYNTNPTSPSRGPSSVYGMILLYLSLIHIQMCIRDSLTINYNINHIHFLTQLYKKQTLS